MLNFKSKYVNENLFMTEDSLILVVVTLKKFELSSQCSPNPGVTKSHIFLMNGAMLIIQRVRFIS